MHLQQMPQIMLFLVKYLTHPLHISLTAGFLTRKAFELIAVENGVRFILPKAKPRLSPHLRDSTVVTSEALSVTNILWVA